MFKETIINDIKNTLENERIIYSKYASISENIQESLIASILELEDELVFSKNKRTLAVEEVEELTANIFEVIKENLDLITNK